MNLLFAAEMKSGLRGSLLRSENFLVLGIITYVCTFTLISYRQYWMYKQRVEHLVRSLPVKKDYVYGSCDVSKSPLTRLEPYGKSLYFGTNIDLKNASGVDFNDKLQAPLAVYSTYVSFNNFQEGKEEIQSMIYKISLVGAILYLNVDLGGIQNLRAEEYEDLARMFDDANHTLGVPVMLSWRVHPEIDTDTYVESFELMSKALRSKTNLTTMVWSPVASGTYSGLTNDIRGPAREHVDWVSVEVPPSGDVKELIPRFLSDIDDFYKGTIIGHKTRPLPLVLNAEGVKGNAWYDYESLVESLKKYEYIKLIVFPLAQVEGKLDPSFEKLLGEFRQIRGEYKPIMGGRNEVTFLCSGTINARFSNYPTINDRISIMIIRAAEYLFN